MKRNNLIAYNCCLGLILMATAFLPPEPDLWGLFSKTRFVEKLNREHSMYFLYPSFTDELKAWEGKEVRLSGFHIPLEVSDADYLILSKFPMAECFFCGGAGPESIAVVYLKEAKRKRIKTDEIIAVVDALNFFKDFGSAETVHSSQLNPDEEDQRAIVNLLTDQLEFANVIVINKSDLVEEGQLKELYAIIHKLNPNAEILIASFGKISLDKIIGTQKFDFETSSKSVAWQQELEKYPYPKQRNMVLALLCSGPKNHFIRKGSGVLSITNGLPM